MKRIGALYKNRNSMRNAASRESASPMSKPRFATPSGQGFDLRFLRYVAGPKTDPPYEFRQVATKTSSCASSHNSVPLAP